MASRRKQSEEEEFEVLDLTKIDDDRVRELWKRFVGDISKQSAAKQVGVGAVAGVASGWLFMKVGKTAAGTLGFSILLIQVAQHQGYIQINWDRVNSGLQNARSQVRNAANRRCPGIVNNLKDFVQKNMFLALGFGGGFLVGLAV